MELVQHSRDALPRPTLGASLRAARLDRNISLETVAAHTKINVRFFRDLERDDLSHWPTNQFYRESYLRGYAEAVGLDPAEVIAAFRRELVVDGSRSVAGNSNVTTTATQRRLTPVTIPIIIAVTFVSVYSLARWTAAVQPDPTSVATTSPATRSLAPPAASEPASPPQIKLPTAVPPPPDAPAAVDLEQVEGELLITSSPSGAHVVVNGIGRGPTPARVRFLPPGSYAVRFLLPGYASTTRTAEISPARLRVRVSAKLEPAPLPRAQVPAESSAPAVDLDGGPSQ